MLTEERHAIILDTINRQHSVRLNELCELLGTSESTIRRDLTALDEKGLLTKVHGGAIAPGNPLYASKYLQFDIPSQTTPRSNRFPAGIITGNSRKMQLCGPVWMLFPLRFQCRHSKLAQRASDLEGNICHSCL